MKRAVCLIVVLMAAMPGLAKAEPPVYFPDANLKAEVEGELGISNPTPTDMLGLASLDCYLEGITDLTGLEYAINLTYLHLGWNQISDISALSGLTNLLRLGLYKNQISDISALAGLTNLTDLNLRDNQISDISALAGLTNLTELHLRRNQISDISAVSGLANLTWLALADNQISDISAVSGLMNMTRLYLGYNMQISDISAVSGLINLMELYLNDNQISDISAVAGLTNLTELTLDDNEISDISAVAGLTNLTFLLLDGNQISDISALPGLINLTFLHLYANPLNEAAYCTHLPLMLGITYLSYHANPNPPTGVLASDGTYTDKVQITWDTVCSATGDTYYHVYRSDSEGGTKTALGDWQISTSYDDTTATAGTTYYYWLKAKTQDDDGYYGETDYSSYDTGWKKGAGIQRTLTISSTSGGSVSEPGKGLFQYEHGQVISIAATANPTYRFVNWTGSAVDAGKVADPSAASTTVTVDGDYTLQANFAAEPPAIELPTVSTLSATNVEETTARLRGRIQDDGGEACQYRFRYKKSGGSYSYTSWTGSKTTGQSFSEERTELTPGSTYYFNARAKNSVGESNWGNQKSFTTNVVLTLYVHEDSISGPIIAGARVTGQDGAGNSFGRTTNSSGYVTITGTPGTWQFTASKSGYETNSWSQSTTSSVTRDAYLIRPPEEPPALPDLCITSKSLEFFNDEPPFLPNVLKIKATVTNEGNTEAENVIVKFTLNGELLGEESLGPIKPKEQKPATVKWEANSNVENATITAEVIAIGQQEDNLSNNTTSQPVSFYWVDFRHDRDAFSFPNPYFEHWYDYFTEISTVIKEAKVTHKVVAVLGGWFLESLSIKGHCYGMASASTIWYTDRGEKPIDIPTYDMSYEEDKVKADIVLYHWRGILSVIPGLTERLLFYNAERQYDLILQDIKSGEPAVIALWDLPGGHATVAYKVLDLGNEKHVYVYENELPLDLKEADYDIEFNISSNEGKYELGFDKVIYVPKKLFVTPLEWSDIQELLKQINKELWKDRQVFFWVHSPVIPLVTDEFGRKVGYIDNTTINEIPGAEIGQQLDSYLFRLPSDLTYLIELTGTAKGTLGLDFVVPLSESRARVVTYEDIPVTPGSKATTTLSATEVASKVTLDTGEIIEPESIDEVDFDNISLAGKEPIVYVDDDGPNDPEPNNPAISDPNENGSAEHPFDMIQEGIDAALDGETVFVRDGTYREAIEFAGRNITVTGFDPNEPNAIPPYPVIDANYVGTAVTFRNEEEPNCILEGFVITRGAGEVAGGINCMGSSPTISHCLIVGNLVIDPNGGGGAAYLVDSNAVFENCTFSKNYGGEQGAGLYLCDSNAVLLNCIVWDNQPYQIAVACGLDPNITFSDVQGTWPGQGNIDNAPCFAELGYWADANNPNIAVEPSEANAVWVGGDYHLKSQAGRWEPYSASWLIDDVTSLCIDAGDPNSDWTAELWPHGKRINMGAYGGTPQASMSLSTARTGGEWTYDGGIFVGVYYYPWYGPTAHRISQSLRGHLVPQQTAELGEYDNASQEVITRHIDYSHRANIHFWACSWWGPGTYVDNVLRYHILPHKYAGELRYAIMYESTGRLGSFSNPDYSNLLPDFQYFADNYFSDPNYLKIDGRPVVFIYLTRVYFRKKLGYDALAALRAAFPNIYIIADDIFGRNYSSANASKWDAVTAYDVYGQTLQSYGSTGAALNQLESILSEAKAAANSVGVGLIPFAAPGFNDKGVRGGHNGAPRYFEDDPSSSEGDLFRSMLRNVVVPKVDPLAENILMVTSFNEWHEDTQIEPTMGTGGTTNIDDSATGSDYTQGDYYTDYGYLYLDILSQETSVDFLPEALDTALSFTTGGSADWFSQTTTSHNDGDAAQSGDISRRQESWMQTTVSGTGTVKFYWKVSSEEDFDFLEFYIDGSRQEKISGSVSWEQKTYTISTSGSHVLEWRYTKDGSVSSGSDCGWVDKVEWGS